MEVDENDENESVLLAQEMEIDEENVGAALPAQEFEVVSIPSEICDELGDLLGKIEENKIYVFFQNPRASSLTYMIRPY